MNLAIAAGATILLQQAGTDFDVDCRLLFMSDRYRQLLRAYPEIVHRLSQPIEAGQVADYVRESAEICQYYDLNESEQCIALTLRDEFFREPASLEGLKFELSVSAASRRRQYQLPLERFAALGQLLPLLNGDHSESEIQVTLRKRLSDEAFDWISRLQASLRSDGFIAQTAGVRQNFLTLARDRPRVTFVAHTSLLVQSKRTAVLFDPLLRRSCGLPEKGFDVTRLKLGAICCSHSHWDHCDVASLLLFDKRTPVIIPKVSKTTIFNPPISPMLRLLGFDDIREVELWKPIQIDDIEIVPVPFHGEQDEPDAEIDHYTYVVRTEGLSLYGGVDAYRDTFGDMMADLERVRRDYAPTVAFLPVSRMTYAYAHGGVNGFCRKISTGLLDQFFQYTAGPEDAVKWSRLLDARCVVPYATFTFNASTAAPQVCDFLRQMAAAGLGDRVMALRPQDSLEPDDLKQNWQRDIRRAYLFTWLRSVAAFKSLDHGLAKFVVYRGLRRLWSGTRAPVAHHH
jgi:L-ascorbate metabolism protein UlaG (beta-lactamase superfamily)